MSKQKEYVKLPGQGRSSFGVVTAIRYSLWLARDHLLAVMNQGYSEDYKRFYFRDIQAIILQKTSAGAVANAVLGTILFIIASLTAFGYERKWDTVGLGFLICFDTVFLLCLLVNLAKGPTCKCFLRTAVQTERLYSLHRVRPAHRTIKRIREAVEAEQGILTSEYVTAASQMEYEKTSTTQGLPARPMPQPVQSVHETVRHYNGRVHLILFCVMLADSITSCMSILAPGTAIKAITSLATLAALGLTIAAILKQRRSDIPDTVKAITWSTLANIGVFWIIGIVYGSILVFSAAIKSGRAITTTDQPPTPLIVILTILYSAISACLAVLGTSRLLKFRKESAVPPPLIETSQESDSSGTLNSGSEQ